MIFGVINERIEDLEDENKKLLDEITALRKVAEAASLCPNDNCDIHYHPQMQTALKEWREGGGDDK